MNPSTNSAAPVPALTPLAGIVEAENIMSTWYGWYVLLWSQSQNALHIEPVKDMLTSNRRAYSEDRRMDYVPLLFGPRDDCDSLASSIRGTMRLRQIERPERVTI